MLLVANRISIARQPEIEQPQGIGLVCQPVLNLPKIEIDV